MKKREILYSACLFLLLFTSCSTFYSKKTTPDDSAKIESSQKDSSTPLADSTNSVDYTKFEETLNNISNYYDRAMRAHDESDYALAETMIDSASVLIADLDLEQIKDESLLTRYRITMSSLFQEYGRILSESTKIQQDDPMNWLKDLTASANEEFKNGKWTDEELRMIVNRISLRCDVPIDYNDKVKNCILYFQTDGRKYMEKWLQRSGYYFPMIQDIFSKNQMPNDMIYLAMIESGLNPTAYSRMSASGLWQFILSTGRIYGLKRTEWIDERRDPIKSTTAAAQHLNDLFEIFNDWRLVMAAYNCGPNRVTREIQRCGTNDFWLLNLPEETKNYVPSFMAATIIAKAPELFGFDNIQYQNPMEYEEVEVHPYTDLSIAASCAGINKDILKNLNFELLRERTPAGKEKYSLKIPKGCKDKFIEAYAKIPVEKYSPPRQGYHVVKKGETFSGIAKKYGVSIAKLKSANKKKNPNRLTTGEKLVIPGLEDEVAVVTDENNTDTKKVSSKSTSKKTSKKTSSTEKTSTNQVIYIVQKNDTLYEIAQKYNVSHKSIMEWNKIKDHRTIKPGQKIIIKVKNDI